MRLPVVCNLRKATHSKICRGAVMLSLVIHFISFTIAVFLLFSLEMQIFLEDSERITGRKARGLQMEEIGCKCQTFFSLLSGRRKLSIFFSFSIQI